MISPHYRAKAFSLIEVTFALGVAAVCLLAVAGLLTVGVQTNKRSTSQNIATNVLAAAVADLHAMPKVPFGQPPTASSPLFGFLPIGETTLFFDINGIQTNVVSEQYYRLLVTTTNSGGTTPTYAWFQVTWPAIINPDTGTPEGSVEGSAMFDLHY